MRDEAVTTAAGDPIGIRFLFLMSAPKRVVANVSASAFASSETKAPWMHEDLGFRAYEQTIQPLPCSDDIYDVFELPSCS